MASAVQSELETEIPEIENQDFNEEVPLVFSIGIQTVILTKERSAQYKDTEILEHRQL